MTQPFPFSAIVGQEEMKRAVILAAIDPAIGGVLVFGDRGTGKSTAVRALAALLPPILAVVGCPVASARVEDVPDWADAGTEIAERPTPVVDLPLGATEDRVTGALDIERALTRGEKAFQPGLLARANRGFLYIDEVNLLEDHVVDLLLDVAQSGENVVEREGLSIRHAARFVLIGSGNPEEGELRPQLLDRFGLSVEVGSPTTIDERVEVVRRRDAYETDRAAFLAGWAAEDAGLRDRIVAAARRSGGGRDPRGGAARLRGAVPRARLGRAARRADAPARGAGAGGAGGRGGDRPGADPRGRARRAAPPAAPRPAGRGRVRRAGGARHRAALGRVSDEGDPAAALLIRAVALLSVDPAGLRGMVLRARAGPIA